MKYFYNVLHLFFPKICITCDTELLSLEKLICTYCRHDLPIICYKNFKDNKIKNAFRGRIPIKKASAFLYFRKIGKTKKIIHSLKYHGNQEIGELLGHWFGKILKDSHQFDNIDHIIPVPLHKKKLKQRRFNQLTLFGQCLSKQLQTKFTPNILVKRASSETQTFKPRLDRFSKDQTQFNITDWEIFKNKHVLLIDDVITTGATLEACSNELLKIKNLKISIAAMAYTE